MSYGFYSNNGAPSNFVQPNSTNSSSGSAPAPSAGAAASADTSGTPSYSQILQGYSQQMALAQSMGQQGMADIATQYKGINSGIQQNLMSRGLQDTTIAPTMALGVQQQQTAAQNRYRDQLTQQQLGIGQNQLNYMQQLQMAGMRNAQGYGGGLSDGGNQNAGSYDINGSQISGNNTNPGVGNQYLGGGLGVQAGAGGMVQQPGTGTLGYNGTPYGTSFSGTSVPYGASFAGTSGMNPYRQNNYRNNAMAPNTGLA